jgi:peptide/nickel transport system substrate-binding protein
MLKRGEIDVITPFAQDLPALLAELRKIDGVTARTAPTTAVDLLMFNTDGELGSRPLREALARCVPRQEILNRVIKPSQPDAEVPRARLLTPAQAGYDEIADGSGGPDWADADIPGAKAALTAGGRESLTVRLGWYRPEDGGGTSDRRGEVVRLMQETCRQAGITVEDAGSATFLEDAYDPEKRDWDVALMGWSLEPGAATGDDLYHTYEGSHGKYNLGNYSNPELDRLLERYGAELDPALRQDRLVEIEELMWQDLPSLPLYALPDIVATAPGVTGVELNATEAGLTWNAEEWDLT